MPNTLEPNTSGITNTNLILIVLLVAAIVLGAVLWYYALQDEEPEVLETQESSDENTEFNIDADIPNLLNEEEQGQNGATSTP